MDKNKKAGPTANDNNREENAAANRINEKAHREADRDMEEDAELTAQSPNDDLDEGETARLGEDGNPIV